MTEPEPTDDATDADAPAAGSGKARTAPADPKADVEARRAATKARMEGGEGGPAKATAEDPTGARARRGAGAKGTATSDDPTGAKASRAATKGRSVPRPSKRTGGADAQAARSAAARSGNPKKAAAAAAEPSRYTAPIPRSQIESPRWVPILMFGLLGLGMVVIFLTYVAWGGRPLALGVGLGLILGGILTATQLR